MKFGTWIQVTGALLASVSSSQAQASNVDAERLQAVEVLREDTTLSTQEFLDALARLNIDEKTSFDEGTPCVSVSAPTRER